MLAKRGQHALWLASAIWEHTHQSADQRKISGPFLYRDLAHFYYAIDNMHSYLTSQPTLRLELEHQWQYVWIWRYASLFGPH